jgi:serine O-acetyltransferase
MGWNRTCPTLTNQPNRRAMWTLPDSSRIRDELLGRFSEAAKAGEMQQLCQTLRGVIERAAELVSEDLVACALCDQASKSKAELIFETHASFKAVLLYCFAHEVRKFDRTFGQSRELIAHKLSNNGKLLSGIDIYPAARIGRRIVLDHGFGTVVGETCGFGDDCYILSGVILGATGIAGNATDKRHPRRGNRVEVGSGARIFGPVAIGDDVFISPSCVITQDVPGGTAVRVINQVQVQKKEVRSGFGGFLRAFARQKRLHLVGDLADVVDAFVLDAGHQRLSCLEMDCATHDVNHV